MAGGGFCGAAQGWGAGGGVDVAVGAGVAVGAVGVAGMSVRGRVLRRCWRFAYWLYHKLEDARPAGGWR